jgi:hypothetical protein
VDDWIGCWSFGRKFCTWSNGIRILREGGVREGGVSFWKILNWVLFSVLECSVSEEVIV